MFVKREFAKLTTIVWLLTGCTNCRGPMPTDVLPMDASSELPVVVSDVPSRADRDVPTGRPDLNLGPECRSVPESHLRNVSDASCGENCIRTAINPPRELVTIRERGGVFEVPANLDLHTYRPPSPTRSFVPMDFRVAEPPGSGALCPEGFSGGGFGVDGDKLLFKCGRSVGNDYQWHLFSLDEMRATSCRVHSETSRALGFSPRHLMRVPGVYAWVQGFDAIGPGDLVVVDDGATESRRVLNCGCVIEAGAAGDTIAFIRDAPNLGRVLSQLWILRPPYRQPQMVWSGDVSMQWLSQDPTNVYRFYFAGTSASSDCEAGGDIYTFDARTVDREPPRNITQSASTQTFPVGHGDWVAYLDFATDSLTPNGCVEADHDADQNVLHNIVTGERVALSKPRGAGPVVSIGSAYAMLTGGFFVPLPPNVRP